MAGSLRHIVDSDTGKFTMDCLDHMGDAREALSECFHLIIAMTGGDMDEVNEYCRALCFPEIHRNMNNAEEYRND